MEPYIWIPVLYGIGYVAFYYPTVKFYAKSNMFRTTRGYPRDDDDYGWMTTCAVLLTLLWPTYAVLGAFYYAGIGLRSITKHADGVKVSKVRAS